MTSFYLPHTVHCKLFVTKTFHWEIGVALCLELVDKLCVYIQQELLIVGLAVTMVGVI